MSIREKRTRRQAKQALAHGARAKPTHKAKSGRSGSVLAKQLGGRKK